MSKFLSLLYFIGALGSVIAVPYQAAFKVPSKHRYLRLALLVMNFYHATFFIVLQNLEIYMFCISYAFDLIYVTKMIVSFYTSSVDSDGTIVGEWGDIIAKCEENYKPFNSFSEFVNQLFIFF